MKLEDKSMPGLKPKHHLNFPAEVLATANFVNNFVKYWILLKLHCISYCENLVAVLVKQLILIQFDILEIETNLFLPLKEEMKF